MKRASAALMAAAAAALTAPGCGGGGTAPPPRGAATPAAVSSTDYVASPTLGRGTSERLFAIPGLGAFRATCARPGEARISYRVKKRGGTTQLVTAEPGRGSGSNRWADPGERVAIPIGGSRAARADWQVALIAEGRITVVTASFTVGVLGDRFGCFVTGTAHSATRPR
jgi:hypothetical protein